MSLDLMVYTPKEAVSRTAIVQQMRSMGWDVLFLSDYFNMAPATGDKLENYEHAIGWPAESEFAEHIKETIATRNKDAFDELYLNMEVGACEVYIGGVEGDFDECIPENLRPDKLRMLKATKTIFHLCTAGGRSPLSSKFQSVLWQAVGKASEGLLEDPQVGFCGYSGEMAEYGALTEAYIKQYIPPTKPPMTVIEWYLIFALVGAIGLFMNRSFSFADNWSSYFLLLYVPLSYGLYRGVRWVWQVCVGFSTLAIALGIFSLIGFGVSLIKLLLIGVHGFVLTAD